MMYFNDMYETSAWLFVIICLIVLSIVGSICMAIFYIVIYTLSLLMILRDVLKNLSLIGLAVLSKTLNKLKYKIDNKKG